MKSSRGFTMVEMVIGLLLLGMIIVIAMSFMVFQSRYGRTATAQRSSREVVTLALNMIARDVRQAGYGLGDDLSDSGSVIDSLDLAILPDPGSYAVQTYDDGSTHYCYDRLFVHYGMYFREGLYLTDPPVPPDYSNNLSPAIFAAAPAPGGPRFYKPGAVSGNYPFTGTGIELTSVTTSNFVKNSLKDRQIGAVIGYRYDLLTNKKSGILLDYDTSNGVYSLASATQPNTYYAPAIVYSYQGQPNYELRRNGERLVGGGLDIRVTGFCVRAMFYDTSQSPNEVEVPQLLTSKRFELQAIRKLRTLTITLRYKIRQKIDTSDPEQPWTLAPEMKRSIVVVPRAIVMQAALTGDEALVPLP